MLLTQPNRKLCSNCNLQLVKPNGKSKHGFTKWHKYCSSCAKSIYDDKFSHRKNKKLVCDSCGFKAVDKCQLDLIYLDENSKNKNSENTKTICANCNRIYSKNKKNILDITVDSDVLL
jgi:predicted RNA-binding Zn-ribbon protein involved in translation (DUF1610 family)